MLCRISLISKVQLLVMINVGDGDEACGGNIGSAIIPCNIRCVVMLEVCVCAKICED